VPLFQEIITLRDEAARMLGYADHASLRIETKMAKTPATVNEFLGDLRKRLAPGGVKEADRLLEYKKEDCEKRGASFDGSLYMWDVPYYSRVMKEKEYSVDEVEISQYFPVESTFAGMLKIFEEIFGFAFVELKEEDRARLSPTGKAEDIVWHEEVKVYTVWDDEAAGSGFCGYLYLDLHPRDNKYGHNANFNLEPGYIRDDGSKNYSCATSASRRRPSLLCSSTTRLSRSSTSSATASMTWPLAPDTATSTARLSSMTLSRRHRRCLRTGAGPPACSSPCRGDGTPTPRSLTTWLSGL